MLFTYNQHINRWYQFQHKKQERLFAIRIPCILHNGVRMTLIAQVVLMTHQTVIEVLRTTYIAFVVDRVEDTINTRDGRNNIVQHRMKPPFRFNTPCCVCHQSGKVYRSFMLDSYSNAR